MHANNTSAGVIGLTFTSIGNNDLINTAGATLDGGPSYNGKGFYSLGISYIKPLGSYIDFETGIAYSRHTVTIIPNLPPDHEQTPKTEKISLLNIPVTARINFLNYLYINGGLILGTEINFSDNIDSQNGIGVLLGLGGRYCFDNRLGAFVNLYQQFHSLLSFGAGGNDYRWRLMDGGLRIGFTYNLHGQ